MIWILVFLSVNFNVVESTIEGHYSNHMDCFYARESFSHYVGGENGYYPPGMQALCLQVTEDQYTPKWEHQ